MQIKIITFLRSFNGSIRITVRVFSFLFMFGLFLLFFIIFNLFIFYLPFFFHVIKHLVFKFGRNVEFLQISSVCFFFSFRLWSLFGFGRGNRTSIAWLGTRVLFFSFLFIVAFKECKIIFEDTLMTDWDSILLHSLFYFLHMIFNWVFGFKIVLQLFKDFENKFFLLF